MFRLQLGFTLSLIQWGFVYSGYSGAVLSFSGVRGLRGYPLKGSALFSLYANHPFKVTFCVLWEMFKDWGINPGFRLSGCWVVLVVSVLGVGVLGLSWVVGVLGAFVRSANLGQSAKERIYKYNNINNNLFLLGLGTGIKQTTPTQRENLTAYLTLITFGYFSMKFFLENFSGNFFMDFLLCE